MKLPFYRESLSEKDCLNCLVYHRLRNRACSRYVDCKADRTPEDTTWGQEHFPLDGDWEDAMPRLDGETGRRWSFTESEVAEWKHRVYGK